ncbi:MAG: AAA family ATPase [Chloroflexota bacterium]
MQLRRLVRGRINDDRPILLAATTQQRAVLNRTRDRRVEVIGPAGSGKSMLAAEKARKLAADGYRTLLVCFNQPLATSLRRELADDISAAEQRGGLQVATFHRLAEVLAVEAGLLEPHGPNLPDGWFAALPGALERAIPMLPGERFHAIVIDEGQDFEAEWLLVLQQLLYEPDEGVLWVFHDPGQAIRGPDLVHQLDLPETLYLYENLRNPPSIAALAARFYTGGESIWDQRGLLEGVDADSAAAPRFTVITARPGRDTVEAVRRELHRLRIVEHVRAWELAVLSGTSAARSDVWAARRYGDCELWNGAIRDDGTSLGLPLEDVPDEPMDDGAVLFETVRRFKGLERSVVILCELPSEGPRLNELLYSALTRPTTELVIIAPPDLAARLRR